MSLTEISPDTKLTLAEWCELFGRDLRSPEDKVLTIKEWAREAGISIKTAQNLISRGEGPSVVELSPNRLGVRVCDHRAWLAARTRKCTTSSSTQARAKIRHSK
jgi:predicted DNA-binding transcriptional regulator AlpA